MDGDAPKRYHRQGAKAACLGKSWWQDPVRAEAAADRMRHRHGAGCSCVAYLCPLGAETRGQDHLHIGHTVRCKGNPDIPAAATRWLTLMSEEEWWRSLLSPSHTT